MPPPAPEGSNAAKPAVNASASETNSTNKEPQQKPAAALEEDDEFEDFPVEDWAEEDTELPSGNQHLWEESWDDDDTTEDFSAQLKEELKKVEATRRT